jgi:hypothetical protein
MPAAGLLMLNEVQERVFQGAVSVMAGMTSGSPQMAARAPLLMAAAPHDRYIHRLHDDTRSAVNRIEFLKRKGTNDDDAARGKIG